MMPKERQCPRCGASYDPAWRMCDSCGVQIPARPFLRPAIQASMPAIRAAISREVAKHELGTTQRGPQRPFYGSADVVVPDVTDALRAVADKVAKGVRRGRR